MLSTRVRAATSQITPSIRRILAHSLILGLAMSVADLLFNFYLVSLGYSTGTAGYLSTIYRFAGVVAGVPIGMLIDRAGPQRSLQLGAALFAIGWSIQLLQTELWALMMTQAMIGAAGLLALTAVVPLLTGVTPPSQRASIFGLNAGAATVIGLVGATVGGLLPTIAGGLASVGPQTTLAYRIALGSVVLLAILALLPVARRIEVIASERGHASASDTPAARLSLRQLMRLALPALTLGIGAGAFLPFQNLFFRQQFHLPDAIVGATLAGGALSMGLGAMLGSTVARRLGLKRASALTRVLATPSMLLMLVPYFPVALLGFLVRGWGIGASFPLSDAYIMQIIAPRNRGQVVSTLSILWSLGWAATSSVAGWVEERYGFTPLLVVAALSYVLSALATLNLPEPRKEAGQ